MLLNSVQTVTLNSALSQNWVVCTVRTPRNQVARTLRVQCPGSGRCCVHSRLVARMSRARPAQVTRLLGVRWSRHARQPALGRDLKTPGCDTKLTQHLPRPGRNAKSRSRPSWRLPYVVTSISCRDLVSVHSGISRSRPQKSRSRPSPLPPMSRPQK